MGLYSEHLSSVWLLKNTFCLTYNLLQAFCYILNLELKGLV